MAQSGLVEATALLKQGARLKSQKVKNKEEEIHQRWVLGALYMPERQKNNALHASCLVDEYQEIIQKRECLAQVDCKLLCIPVAVI